MYIPSGAATLHALIQKNAVELVKTRLLQLNFLRSNNRCRPLLDLRHSEHISKNGNTRNYDLPSSRIVRNVHRLQRRLPPHSSPGSTYVFTSRVSSTSLKYYLLACPKLPWREGGQTGGLKPGYKDPPVIR